MSLLRLARPRFLVSQFQPTLLRTFITTPLRLDSNHPTDSAAASDPKSLIQAELKAALRAKDKPRLNVLRSLLADITNASHTNKPISTPLQYYTLLNSQIKASRTAISEFSAAGRDDLVAKETAQIHILEHLQEGVPKVSHEEVDRIVEGVVDSWEGDKGTMTFGSVMKKVQEVLKGRPHDTGYLVEEIKRIAAAVPGKEKA